MTISEELNELAMSLDIHEHSCRARLDLSSNGADDSARLQGKAAAYKHAAEMVRDLAGRLAAEGETAERRRGA